MLSLEQHITTAVLYAMVEGAIRMSVAPRLYATQSLVHRQNKKNTIDTVRSTLENGFQLQCLYIDQFAEIIAIFTAFPASLMIRARYNQGLNLGIIGVSFFIQLALELSGDVLFSLWEAGVLGYRRRTAVWRYHQSHHLYLKYCILPVMWAPLFSSVWFQAAVLGVPATNS